MTSLPTERVEPPLQDDFELVRIAQTGDFAAFEQLVQRFQTRVYNTAYRILGQSHDAEDVVQQTFLSMIEHLESFRGESSVLSWVLRIATNFALKILRKRRGLPTVSMNQDEESYANIPHPDYIAAWRASPAELLQRQELRGLLDQAISELEDKYRLVFVLRDLEELSTADSAAALGISESNVKVRLLRARMQLRERLTRSLGDEATRILPQHRH